MADSKLVPLILAPFVVWRLYSRTRANVGRQPFHRNRMRVRIVILSVVTLALALYARQNSAALGGLSAGVLLGAPLAFLGLRLTRFESNAEGIFYTPNKWIGLGLLSLLAGRMIYRLYVVYEFAARGGPKPSLFQSPLTVLLFGLSAGYYISYSAGVLLRARRL